MKSKYNLISNNCLHTACKLLLKGKFTGKYSKEIRKAYEFAKAEIRPFDAYEGLCLFYASYKAYYEANAFQRFFMGSPYSISVHIFAINPNGSYYDTSQAGK